MSFNNINMEKEIKYQIEFTEKQLRVMEEALEFYSRYCAGQIQIPSALEQQLLNNGTLNRVLNRIRTTALKSSLFPNLHINESYGIGSDELIEEAKIAYDIYRPILELFNKKNSNVYSSKAPSYSKEKRIIINEI